MKVLLVSVFVAFATADVSHLQSPFSSYGVPQGSVLGNYDQSFSFGRSGSSLPSQINLPGSISFSSVEPSSTQLNASAVDVSFVGASPQVTENSIQFSSTPTPSASFQSYQQGLSGEFPSGSQFQSNPSANVDLSSFQVSSPAPNADLSSFQVSTPSPVSFYNSGVGSVNAGSFDSNVQLNPSYGFGNAAGASLNSGFGLDGSQFVSQTSGGNINEAFGNSPAVSSSSGASGSSSSNVVFRTSLKLDDEPPLAPEVTKHLYFFEGPEEEEVQTRINIPRVAPKQNQQIIFVKAPSYRTKATINIPAPPQNEEKTHVYVLVKKPEEEALVNVEQAEPKKPTKPEVFFIKYKTQEEAEEAVAQIQSKHRASSPSGFGTKSNQVNDVASLPTVSSPVPSSVVPSGSSSSNLVGLVGLNQASNSLPSSFPPVNFDSNSVVSGPASFAPNSNLVGLVGLNQASPAGYQPASNSLSYNFEGNGVAGGYPLSGSVGGINQYSGFGSFSPSLSYDSGLTSNSFQSGLNLNLESRSGSADVSASEATPVSSSSASYVSSTVASVSSEDEEVNTEAATVASEEPVQN
ncbi:uncharacterized protein LOC115879079 [Sitophilus oryzae]|uniref:Uncharacterized protein LOC115879079 n=1 Tax=Sitophilus oryzae TaxID=7048 RepID=A0A6J2XLP2_SITOR|nr:uncharacterized protein LOC115879079 [Sitophilus oryzae]